MCFFSLGLDAKIEMERQGDNWLTVLRESMESESVYDKLAAMKGKFFRPKGEMHGDMLPLEDLPRDLAPYTR